MKYIFLFLETILILHMAVKGKFFRNFLAVILLFVMVVQIASIFLTGSFIPEIAISNAFEFLKLDKKYYLFAFLILLLLIAILFLVTKYNKKIISTLSILSIIVMTLFYPKSCLKNFYNELIKSYRVNFSHKISSSDKNKLIKELYKEKIVYDSNVSDYIKPDKYNVIVFFLESLSDVAIKKDVMPNLYNLRQKSIDAKNYYNHTASTFRGLRGQLLSMHQYSATYLSSSLVTNWMKIIDNNKTNKAIHKSYFNTKFGNRPDLISIFNILKQFGYHSYFEMTIEKYHQGNYEFMNVFKSLGADEFYRHYDDNSQETMTDKESFEFLQNKLKDIKQPFFYGFYNVGTHYGKDVPKDGVKFEDGKNEYLNIYYNLDYQFGKFLEFFNNSKLSENTILIITADHASYPTEGFKKAFNSTSNYFVDKIPLIIYKKGITPAKIDVKNLNSLSLAPTICDILGITQAPNRFLGLSIFDKKETPQYLKISTMGENKYKVINGKVVDITNDEKFKKDIEKIDLLEKFGG